MVWFRLGVLDGLLGFGLLLIIRVALHFNESLDVKYVSIFCRTYGIGATPL